MQMTYFNFNIIFLCGFQEGFHMQHGFYRHSSLVLLIQQTTWTLMHDSVIAIKSNGQMK